MADGGIIRKLFVLLGVKGGEDSANAMAKKSGNMPRSYATKRARARPS